MFLIPPSKIVVLAILEPPKLFFLMVRVECVSCTWALQAEHSGHYFWHYFPFSPFSLVFTFLPEGVVLGF